MGKTKKARAPGASPKGEANYTVDQLLERTQELVDQFQFDLALKFCARALQKESDHIIALEMMAGILLETGQPNDALNFLQRCIQLQPDKGFTKYLTLGQMHQGHESLNFYNKAVEILQRDLQTAMDEDETQALRRTLSTVYGSMAEIFLTDCCFDDDAEQRCSNFVELSISTDPSNPEGYQYLASLRMSQQRPEDATAALKQSLSLWYTPTPIPEEGDEEAEELMLDPSTLPEFGFRVSTAKLLMELGEHATALDIAEQLLKEDDEVVQVWYLCGWASYLLDDKEAASEYLSKAKEISTKVGCDDTEMLKHIDELLQELPAVEQETTEETMDMS